MKRADYLFQLGQRAFFVALFFPVFLHLLCRMGFEWWSELPSGAEKTCTAVLAFGLTAVVGYGQFRIPFGLFPTRKGALVVWIALTITHVVGAWVISTSDRALGAIVDLLSIGGVAMLSSSYFALRMWKTADIEY